MRTAEAQTNPAQCRGLQGRGVGHPLGLVRRRHALAAGTLAGAMLACMPALAQNSVAIEDRIESTFDLVLSNPVELAVPLTRRALARRSVEREAAVELMPYAATEPEAAAETALAEAPAEDPVADLVEQAAFEDDADVARMPRPRPVIISEATANSELIGRPLDLVAGAAAPEPTELRLAAVTPQDGGTAEASDDEPVVLVPPVEASADAEELVAAEACLAVADVSDGDGDFERNREALSADGLCIDQEKFRERRRSWVIQTVRSQKPGPLWAIMHDDEDMSFDNAVTALTTYGGTLVAVETEGERNLSGIDPNRNFSADGIGCSKVGNNASPRFTGIFSDLIDPAQPIVALHNNSEEHIEETGGLGHVSMSLAPRSMRVSPALDPDGPLAGEHALVLLAAPDLDDPLAAGRTAVLNERGVNVVLERVREGRGDCSLSNYAVLTGNPNYFNVTVHHDERDKQAEIVDILMSGTTQTVASQ